MNASAYLLKHTPHLSALGASLHAADGNQAC
jgi:hypothetical protein